MQLTGGDHNTVCSVVHGSACSLCHELLMGPSLCLGSLSHGPITSCAHSLSKFLMATLPNILIQLHPIRASIGKGLSENLTSVFSDIIPYEKPVINTPEIVDNQ